MASINVESDIDMESNMDLRHEHNTKEKAKARKSGPSLCSKTKDLGHLANVFALTVYWDPTHLCYRTEVHLPEGETLPDVNGLISEVLSEEACQNPNRQRRRPHKQSHHSARPRRHVRRSARRRQARQSQESSQPLTNQKIIDLRYSDASDDEASLYDKSESDATESGHHTPSPTIKAETVVEQQEESSRTPKENASQMPTSSSNSTHDCTQSSQPGDIMPGSDDLGETWESLTFSGHSDSIGDDLLSWTEIDTNFETNKPDNNLFSEETSVSRSISRPAEPIMLPPLKELRLPRRLPPPQVPDKEFRRIIRDTFLALEAFPNQDYASRSQPCPRYRLPPYRRRLSHYSK